MKFDQTYWNPFYFGRYQDEFLITQTGLPCLVCLLLFLFAASRKGKSGGYLVSVCVFAGYLWIFAGATVFPFPMHFHPEGFPYGSLHLIPALIEGTDSNFRLGNIQVWGNFLAGVPFGVIFPFVGSDKNSTPSRVAAWGLVLALAPEVVQLMQNWLFDEFLGRTVDIDDVWLCFSGTFLGYGILWSSARMYCHMGWSRGEHMPIWNHFHEVFLRVGSPARPPTATNVSSSLKSTGA